MLSSSSLEPDRIEYIDVLSELFTFTSYYPSNPDLFESEAIKLTKPPHGTGRLANCFQGLFLRHHVVAMKCSHDYGADVDVSAITVSLST